MKFKKDEPSVDCVAIRNFKVAGELVQEGDEVTLTAQEFRICRSKVVPVDSREAEAAKENAEKRESSPEEVEAAAKAAEAEAEAKAKAEAEAKAKAEAEAKKKAAAK